MTDYRHSGLMQDQYLDAIFKLLALIRFYGKMKAPHFLTDCLTYAKKESLSQKQYDAIVKMYNRDIKNIS